MGAVGLFVVGAEVGAVGAAVGGVGLFVVGFFVGERVGVLVVGFFVGERVGVLVVGEGVGEVVGTALEIQAQMTGMNESQVAVPALIMVLEVDV